MAGYGEPWHCVRELKDNGPSDEPTHVAVDHDSGETDPDNGALVLESADEARLARAVACVNFLAGVPNAVLAGKSIDGTLLGLLRAVHCNPNDEGEPAAPSPTGSSSGRPAQKRRGGRRDRRRRHESGAVLLFYALLAAVAMAVLCRWRENSPGEPGFLLRRVHRWPSSATAEGSAGDPSEVAGRCHPIVAGTRVTVVASASDGG